MVGLQLTSTEAWPTTASPCRRLPRHSWVAAVCSMGKIAMRYRAWDAIGHRRPGTTAEQRGATELHTGVLGTPPSAPSTVEHDRPPPASSPHIPRVPWPMAFQVNCVIIEPKGWLYTYSSSQCLFMYYSPIQVTVLKRKNWLYYLAHIVKW